MVFHLTSNIEKKTSGFWQHFKDFTEKQTDYAFSQLLISDHAYTLVLFQELSCRWGSPLLEVCTDLSPATRFLNAHELARAPHLQLGNMSQTYIPICSKYFLQSVFKKHSDFMYFSFYSYFQANQSRSAFVFLLTMLLKRKTVSHYIGRKKNTI